MVTRKPQILLVIPSLVGSFIRQDIDLLSRDFRVMTWSYCGGTSIADLWRGVGQAETILIWFAGRHAIPAVLVARMRRVPIGIIIGGWEAAWIPEIGYGIRPGSLRQHVLRHVISRASALITVSDATRAGTLQLVPDKAHQTSRIYHGIDTDRFSLPVRIECKTVLTVANINRETIQVKGLALFRQTAAEMPGEEFILVGPTSDLDGQRFVESLPPNMRWVGPRYGDDLIAEFQRASVYFQGSRHESFSVSTAEAMACGCIPVVSSNGALPEVVGDTGVYIKAHTPGAAADAVREALSLTEEHRSAVRQRIIDQFPLSRRQDKLCAVVARLVAGRPEQRGDVG